MCTHQKQFHFLFTRIEFTCHTRQWRTRIAARHNWWESRMKNCYHPLCTRRSRCVSFLIWNFAISFQARLSGAFLWWVLLIMCPQQIHDWYMLSNSFVFILRNTLFEALLTHTHTHARDSARCKRLCRREKRKMWSKGKIFAIALTNKKSFAQSDKVFESWRVWCFCSFEDSGNGNSSQQAKRTLTELNFNPVSVSSVTLSLQQCFCLAAKNNAIHHRTSELSLKSELRGSPAKICFMIHDFFIRVSSDDRGIQKAMTHMKAHDDWWETFINKPFNRLKRFRVDNSNCGRCSSFLSSRVNRRVASCFMARSEIST